MRKTLLKSKFTLLGDGAFLRGAGGFINAALSLAALRSDTITDGETCLLCPRGLRFL